MPMPNEPNMIQTMQKKPYQTQVLVAPISEI